MQQEQLLEKVIQVLESNKIEYMITGSTVSSLQGVPRSTHDVDIVVMIDYSAIDVLVKAFPSPQYYLSDDAIKDAIDHKFMFNLIDITQANKVDFWLFKNDAFDATRFSRKYQDDTLGFKIKVSSPEDTILAKLKWMKEFSGSEKHFIDAMNIYELQYAILDKKYLDEWADKLQVKDLFEKLKEQAKPFK